MIKNQEYKNAALRALKGKWAPAVIATIVYLLIGLVIAGPYYFFSFKNPTVDFRTVLLATLVMVVAGMIAGYIPAKRAVSIKPVEALAAN